MRTQSFRELLTPLINNKAKTAGQPGAAAAISPKGIRNQEDQHSSGRLNSLYCCARSSKLPSARRRGIHTTKKSLDYVFGMRRFDRAVVAERASGELVSQGCAAVAYSTRPLSSSLPTPTTHSRPRHKPKTGEPWD